MNKLMPGSRKIALLPQHDPTGLGGGGKRFAKRPIDQGSEAVARFHNAGI
jgi:hypothetical protein